MSKFIDANPKWGEEYLWNNYTEGKKTINVPLESLIMYKPGKRNQELQNEISSKFDKNTTTNISSKEWDKIKDIEALLIRPEDKNLGNLRNKTYEGDELIDRTKLVEDLTLNKNELEKLDKKYLVIFGLDIVYNLKEFFSSNSNVNLKIEITEMPVNICNIFIDIHNDFVENRKLKGPKIEQSVSCRQNIEDIDVDCYVDYNRFGDLDIQEKECRLDMDHSVLSKLDPNFKTKFEKNCECIQCKLPSDTDYFEKEKGVGFCFVDPKKCPDANRGWLGSWRYDEKCATAIDDYQKKGGAIYSQKTQKGGSENKNRLLEKLSEKLVEVQKKLDTVHIEDFENPELKHVCDAMCLSKSCPIIDNLIPVKGVRECGRSWKRSTLDQKKIYCDQITAANNNIPFGPCKEINIQLFESLAEKTGNEIERKVIEILKLGTHLAKTIGVKGVALLYRLKLALDLKKTSKKIINTVLNETKAVIKTVAQLGKVVVQGVTQIVKGSAVVLYYVLVDGVVKHVVKGGKVLGKVVINTVENVYNIIINGSKVAFIEAFKGVMYVFGRIPGKVEEFAEVLITGGVSAGKFIYNVGYKGYEALKYTVFPIGKVVIKQISRVGKFTYHIIVDGIIVNTATIIVNTIKEAGKIAYKVTVKMIETTTYIVKAGFEFTMKIAGVFVEFVWDGTKWAIEGLKLGIKEMKKFQQKYLTYLKTCGGLHIDELGKQIVMELNFCKDKEKLRYFAKPFMDYILGTDKDVFTINLKDETGNNANPLNILNYLDDTDLKKYKKKIDEMLKSRDMGIKVRVKSEEENERHKKLIEEAQTLEERTNILIELGYGSKSQWMDLWTILHKLFYRKDENTGQFETDEYGYKQKIKQKRWKHLKKAIEELEKLGIKRSWLRRWTGDIEEDVKLVVSEREKEQRQRAEQKLKLKEERLTEAEAKLHPPLFPPEISAEEEYTYDDEEYTYDDEEDEESAYSEEGDELPIPPMFQWRWGDLYFYQRLDRLLRWSKHMRATQAIEHLRKKSANENPNRPVDMRLDRGEWQKFETVSDAIEYIRSIQEKYFDDHGVKEEDVIYEKEEDYYDDLLV